ncbi:hypothetical protein BDN72DRAFT_839693 [Pluteus cervinus]|uniref:Uncharacterized protein n=1 Tax=Pluteus cervinus TaxID=181527 RepID=A0ACD3AVY3_9AGAR|nr:hypothetical protein BDN72DRAFT_839693 [Pluteus cervinus]
MSVSLPGPSSDKLTTSSSPPQLAGVSGSSANVQDVVMESPKKTRLGKVARDEPCFITKQFAYTHRVIHWVREVENDPDLKKRIEELLKGRGVAHAMFNLDDPTNCSNVDPNLYASLEEFAFVAVTGTSKTLDTLIALLERENAEQLRYLNEGCSYVRRFDWTSPELLDAEYELVALHSEHFLPCKNMLRIRSSPDEVGGKEYVVGYDRSLRESPGDTDQCPRIPPFCAQPRPGGFPLNPFLVMINAEIKFRRYLRMSYPPLPADVMELINKTIKLVDLIYYNPVPTPNTFGARLQELSNEMKAREARKQGPEHEESDRGKAPETLADTKPAAKHSGSKSHPKKKSREPPPMRPPPGPGATQEETIEYGLYLMSGRDHELDSDEEALLTELYGLPPDPERRYSQLV